MNESDLWFRTEIEIKKAVGSWRYWLLKHGLQKWSGTIFRLWVDQSHLADGYLVIYYRGEFFASVYNTGRVIYG